MIVQPVALDGDRIRLEPLSLAHLDALSEAGAHDDLWRLTRTRAETREGMAEYIESALREQRQGTALPFVTIDKPSGRVAGSTRFGNIDAANRRAEIGWTWITPALQRTYVNSEAKYFMLRHAFEVWDCVRVELKTDVLNTQSRAAILRIGATEEGILRKHMLAQEGRFRDSVYYSILDTEWPAVRDLLRSFLTPT
ncbi:MAG: GNAT family protein [Gemmatimonadaceae bacterium]